MDAFDFLLLLTGFLLGSSIGYLHGKAAKTKEQSADKDIEKGIREYLKKELIESKTISGNYQNDSINKAIEKVRKDLETRITEEDKTKDNNKGQKHQEPFWLLWLSLLLLVVVYFHTQG